METLLKLKVNTVKAVEIAFLTLPNKKNRENKQVKYNYK